MDYQNLTDPVYSPGAPADTGAMKVFSDMVHSYLDLVQRNAFPPAFLGPLLKSQQVFEYKEVLMYEIGYLVALAIGVVFIILMPLVGLFFACCRCCGNCGGKMYQKQTKKMDCKRRFTYFFLLIITLTILAGDICAFYSNSKVDNAINNSFTTFDNTLNNMKTYINTVPKDVDIIINSSSVPINKANSSVIDIGPVLGGMIKSSIEGTANKTLTSVQGMVDVLNNTAKALVTVNNTFNSLIDEQSQLVKNLSDVQAAISKTLADCGSSCTGAPSTSDLVIDANFTSIPDFSGQLKTINTFLDSGIEGTIQNARQNINDIPETVTNQTRSSVKSVQNQLVNIKQKIADARKSIPVVDSLDNINSVFDTASNYTEKYKPEVVKYNYYRWIVCICLSCIILLVVVCNLFGLLLGPCGHKSSVDPTNRSCASNSGGDFFMAGAAFSFIFAWLLMLITAILFAVGGNVYTSFCKPWANQQLYQVVDENVNISKMVNIGGVNLSIANIYKDCQKNTALWSALNLNSLINLDSYLNISQYTGDVNTTMENTNISVSHISFLTPDQKNQVTNVSNSGIDTLDFSNFFFQMNKSITKTNLTAYANNLQIFAANVTNPTYKAQLQNEANTILAIQASIDANLLPQVKSMNTSIANLQATSLTLPTTLNNTQKAIDTAQSFVDNQVVAIVKNETRAFLDTILKYFESYINWSKTMLTTKLARCGPVASAIDSAQVVVCQYLVDSLNAFWFSIGWCTIFFIPSIILSVKLAKYYRRMKSSDTYETSTSQQFLIPRVAARS
ncbi:PREDICTED: prominin-1-A-like [Nanorana parkeri]|uniref:prominin-1-A-like n=1 Tax=Nanorana parkeri TaxID=125878 RepID=UPI000854BF9D|nr:PREDICTED: prominin-1-A-like [Nanorana parkeri]